MSHVCQNDGVFLPAVLICTTVKCSSFPKMFCNSLLIIAPNEKLITKDVQAGMWMKQLCSSLLFVPRVTRRSRNNQHYALICTTPLFYILAPTCFGSGLPSSGSFLDRFDLLEILAGVSWFRSGTTTLRHTGHVTTHYMIYHPFYLYFR
jgi:hypothetical protein